MLTNIKYIDITGLNVCFELNCTCHIGCVIQVILVGSDIRMHLNSHFSLPIFSSNQNFCLFSLKLDFIH